MEDIIPGYQEYKDSLFAKIMEPLGMYMLCKLKLQQLRLRGYPNPSSEEEIQKQLLASKEEINNILSQE